MKQLIAVLSMMIFATSVFAADAPKTTKKDTTATKKADAPKKDLGKKPTPKKKAEKPAESVKK